MLICILKEWLLLQMFLLQLTQILKSSSQLCPCIGQDESPSQCDSKVSDGGVRLNSGKADSAVSFRQNKWASSYFYYKCSSLCEVTWPEGFEALTINSDNKVESHPSFLIHTAIQVQSICGILMAASYQIPTPLKICVLLIQYAESHSHCDITCLDHLATHTGVIWKLDTFTISSEFQWSMRHLMSNFPTFAY